MNSKILAKEIRKTCLNMVHTAKASHIGSALSMVDVLAVLYNEVLAIDPAIPESDDRDYFILSKGHACVGLYATLGHKGFFNLDELDKYGENDSIFMNHISHKVPGVEFSTGSLGHGLPFAVGIAKALIMSGKIEQKVFVLLGDGELAEGSNWEALLFASHHNLDNLTLIVDCNNFQSLTTIDKTLKLEPYTSKLQSFGCEVFDIDGHDFEALRKCFKTESRSNKPKAVLIRTIKGKGVSFMENNIKWHYAPPDRKELEIAIQEIENA